ncbi:AEC family transporter [Chloroflexota bacterium]
MHIFNVIFQSVVALLGIGVLGFWIIKRGILPENVLGFLSKLAIDIALPSVVFANVILEFSPSEFPGWWQLPLWWLFFSAVALCITLITMFISQKSTRSEFAVSLFFQNGIFFPLIVLNGLFGAGAPYISQLFIFIVFHPPMFFGTSRLFFRRKDEDAKGKINLNRILNPVLIATFTAVIIRLLGVETYLPEFFVSIFKILGGMTLPLLMIILGGSLYMDFQHKGRIYYAEIVKFIITKNIIFPLVFLGLLILIRPDYNIALILLLQSAVPPITGVPIATERNGGNRTITNQFVLASFVFAIVSVPAVFILFSRFFPIP